MNNSNKMHPQQIKNLLKLSPSERYEYFIRYCSDFEMVWGLVAGENNWVTFEDFNGEEVLPVWPHSDLAENCCFEEHKQMGAQPQKITLESFIKNLIPNIQSKGILFGVFYDMSRNGITIEGENLKYELEQEVRTVWE